MYNPIYNDVINDPVDISELTMVLKVFWKCRNCGHIHEAFEAPEVCPVCAHPKAYFEVVSKNY